MNGKVAKRLRKAARILPAMKGGDGVKVDHFERLKVVYKKGGYLGTTQYCALMIKIYEMNEKRH